MLHSKFTPKQSACLTCYDGMLRTLLLRSLLSHILLVLANLEDC